MTDLVFEETGIDESLTTPPLDAVEYPCEVCGKESGPYGGRGRKPRRCAEHKRAASTTRSKTTGKNAALAGQAADTLAQYNDLVALVATITRFTYTGEAISNANGEFRDRAYAALLTDPELAQSIVKAGGISGKAALIVSYAMLAGAVVPVATLEFRDKKAERDARLADAENE